MRERMSQLGRDCQNNYYMCKLSKFQATEALLFQRKKNQVLTQDSFITL
jgi:hypothetical protein